MLQQQQGWEAIADELFEVSSWDYLSSLDLPWTWSRVFRLITKALYVPGTYDFIYSFWFPLADLIELVVIPAYFSQPRPVSC